MRPRKPRQKNWHKVTDLLSEIKSLQDNANHQILMDFAEAKGGMMASEQDKLRAEIKSLQDSVKEEQEKCLKQNDEYDELYKKMELKSEENSHYLDENELLRKQLNEMEAKI